MKKLLNSKGFAGPVWLLIIVVAAAIAGVFWWVVKNNPKIAQKACTVLSDNAIFEKAAFTDSKGTKRHVLVSKTEGLPASIELSDEKLCQENTRNTLDLTSAKSLGTVEGVDFFIGDPAEGKTKIAVGLNTTADRGLVVLDEDGIIIADADYLKDRLVNVVFKVPCGPNPTGQECIEGPCPCNAVVLKDQVIGGDGTGWYKGELLELKLTTSNGVFVYHFDPATKQIVHR